MLIASRQRALEQALAPLLAPIFGEHVAWPGIWRDRVEGQPWCRVVHAPGRPGRVTAGTNGLSEHPGLTQVDLWFPGGSGAQPLNAAAEVLHAFFQPGITLTEAGIEVQVYGRNLGTIDDRQQPWIWAPFTIRWTIFAADNL
jgi:hypothetical protein